MNEKRQFEYTHSKSGCCFVITIIKFNRKHLSSTLGHQELEIIYLLFSIECALKTSGY